MCVGFEQVTMLSLSTSMKTTVTVLLACALTLAEKLSIDTNMLEKVRQVKEEPLTPYSRSTLRSAFVWRISVTRTTQTEQWTSQMGDQRDPYRKLVTIMSDTFKDPKRRDIVKQEAKANYPEFLTKLRFQGPDKFIESIVDTKFILYSDLLEKQRMWRENWPSIISLFDMMGEQGFMGMLDNMDEVVNQGPIGWSLRSKPTYWSPGADYYPTQNQDEFVSEVMRRFTIPPPGCYTDSAEAPTPTQGIIYLASTLNITTTIEAESSGDSEDWLTTTERTIERIPINPSLERLFERHFNGSSFNTSYRNRPRGPLEEQFGTDPEALLFYDCTEVTGESTTKKILTHSYTHQTPVLCHEVTTSATSTPAHTKLTTTQMTTPPACNPEWVEFFNNITHGTAKEYVWKLISTTTKKKRRRKLKPGQTEPPEDSTMYVSPEYIVDENLTDTYTFEELTIPTEKKVFKLKYTLPSTTSVTTSKKTRRTVAKLSGSVKRRRHHANVTATTLLSKLHRTLTTHMP